jgi:hypothetical protein
MGRNTGAGTGAMLGMLACVLAGALGACQRPAQGAADIPHTPIPKAEPRFSMELRAGQIHYQGTLAEEAARASVVAALQAAVGATGTLQVEPRTRDAAWAPALGQAALALRDAGGGRLDFAARRIELSGQLDPEQRATLHRDLQRLYPGYALAGALEDVDPRQARPQPGDAAGLVAFLNLRPISFHAGSAMLTGSGVEGVARAARGMRAAGASVRVEALIYPATGAGADAEPALGEQRDNALLTQFALRGIVPPRISTRAAAPTPERDGQISFAAPQPAAPAKN